MDQRIAIATAPWAAWDDYYGTSAKAGASLAVIDGPAVIGSIGLTMTGKGAGVGVPALWVSLDRTASDLIAFTTGGRDGRPTITTRAFADTGFNPRDVQALEDGLMMIGGAGAAGSTAGVARRRAITFWDYAPQAKGAGTFEFTAGYSTRRLAPNAKEFVVYWVVDKNTKQILKVGQTTVGGANGRWTQYLQRARRENRQVAIDYVRFDPSVPKNGPTNPEALLRAAFENQSHRLPWDLSGKRNPLLFPEHP